jgi:hypothetical protein
LWKQWSRYSASRSIVVPVIFSKQLKGAAPTTINSSFGSAVPNPWAMFQPAWFLPVIVFIHRLNCYVFFVLVFLFIFFEKKKIHRTHQCNHYMCTYQYQWPSLSLQYCTVKKEIPLIYRVTNCHILLPQVPLCVEHYINNTIITWVFHFYVQSHFLY